MPRDYEDSDGCENPEDYAALKDCDNPETVADLEVYGLSVGIIELLDRMGCIYIHDLEQLTDAKFLSWRNAGPLMLAKIRAALQNYPAGRTMKTVRECVELQPRGNTKPRQKYRRKKRKPPATV